MLGRCVDVDWAREVEQRRSRSGFILLINSSPIILSSKMETMQPNRPPKRSSLSCMVACAKWTGSVAKLGEMGETQSIPTVFHQDNLGTMSLSKNVQGIRNVKNIGVKYHFVRYIVENKVVKIVYKTILEIMRMH